MNQQSLQNPNELLHRYSKDRSMYMDQDAVRRLKDLVLAQKVPTKEFGFYFNPNNHATSLPHELHAVACAPSTRICNYCGNYDPDVANWFFDSPFDSCCCSCTTSLPPTCETMHQPMNHILSDHEIIRIVYWNDPRPWEFSFSERLWNLIQEKPTYRCETCGVVLDMTTGRIGNNCILCDLASKVHEHNKTRCEVCGEVFEHLYIPGIYNGCKSCKKRGTTT